MDDKVLHSAVGLGSYLTVIFSLLLIYVGFEWLIVTIPFLLAIGKEVIDQIRYKGFDWSEVKATLNPMIVIKWYRERIN